MSDPVDLQIGRTIRKLRIERSISMAVLAASVGVTTQQLQKYEAGKNRVSASRLAKIADILDADIKIFFDAAEDCVADDSGPPPKKLLSHQGLSLVKAFHCIPDEKVRLQVLSYVQRVARRYKGNAPAVQP